MYVDTPAGHEDVSLRLVEIDIRVAIDPKPREEPGEQGLVEVLQLRFLGEQVINRAVSFLECRGYPLERRILWRRPLPIQAQRVNFKTQRCEYPMKRDLPSLTAFCEVVVISFQKTWSCPS